MVDDPIKGFDANKCIYTQRIDFPRPYNQPPYVQLSIEHMDCGSLIEQSPYNREGKRLLHTVMRYDISPVDISGTGFTLKVSTWNSNTIYGFRVSWIAFGESANEKKPRSEELKDNFMQYLAQEIQKYSSTNP